MPPGRGGEHGMMAGAMGKQTTHTRVEKQPGRYRPLERRLRRLAFHLAAFGSAFLFVAAANFWLLSYERQDEFVYRATNGWGWAIFSARGHFGGGDGRFTASTEGFSHYNRLVIDEGELIGAHYVDEMHSTSTTPTYRACEFLGVQYTRVIPLGREFSKHWLSIPYSYLAVLSAITPAAWLLTWKRRRREASIAKGLCRT